MGDIWNDVPLFREIQRVLSSSSGPVNWELARQVGIASASWSAEDPAPTLEDQRAFEEAVRVAELRVAEFTGLEPPSDVARVETVRRSRWVEANIEGLRALLEPAAAKIGDAVVRAQREALPEAEEARGMTQLVGQLSPLLLGAQVGTVLGTLGQHVLGQYDIALPRAGGSGTLLFVVPNIAAFERDWSLDSTEFRTWVAIHEVTHRFEFARSWTLPRFRELLDDYTSTLRLDIEGLQTRRTPRRCRTCSRATKASSVRCSTTSSG
jgi:putative hydrolase